MCGRYGFTPGESFYKRFDVINRLDRLEPHYNVSPGMMMPVIIKSSPNQVVLMRWGLIPFWAKDPRIGYKMINARAEGIENKPAFRVVVRSLSLRFLGYVKEQSDHAQWRSVSYEFSSPHFIRGVAIDYRTSKNF